MSSKQKVSKRVKVWLVVLSILVIIIVGLLFAIFLYNEENKGEEFFDSGSIVMTYVENSDIFFINNMVPLSDEIGKLSNTEADYFDFTVKINMGDSSKTDYEIALEIDEEFTTALPSNVKVYLEKQESGSYIPVSEPETFENLILKSEYNAPDDAKIIAKVSSTETTSHNYRLRMWLAEGTVVTPEVLQSFGVEINVYGETK